MVADDLVGFDVVGVGSWCREVFMVEPSDGGITLSSPRVWGCHGGCRKHWWSRRCARGPHCNAMGVHTVGLIFLGTLWHCVE